MDRTAIIVLVICAVLLLTWKPLIDHFYPPPPTPTNVVSRATSPAAETNAPTSAPSQPTTWMGANAATFVVQTNVPEQLLVLTNNDVRYTFTSRGGGLKDVELIRFPESTSSLRRRRSETNEFATLNAPEVPPVLTILGTREQPLQEDGIYKLIPTTGGVRAEKTLTNGLTLIKDFQLGTNYLVNATVRLENRSSQPLTLPPQQWITGTATPMNPQDRGQFMNVMWFNGEKIADTISLNYFNTNTTTFGIFPRTPRAEYRAGNTNVFWVSAQNQFFALATILTNPAPAVTIHSVNLTPPSLEEINSNPNTVRAPQGLLTALDYPGQTLAPGKSVERTLYIFAGPKRFQTLSSISDSFNYNHFDWIMGFSGDSLFTKIIGSFARLLLAAVNGLHNTFRLPYGWAIVVLTVVIKVIYWPLTQYSTRSAKRMQALAPQMKAIQEKYKDDPQKQQQKIWAFYKENKVNPLSGCLPVLLQLPLLYGFYRMLQSAIELRGAQFLWIGDLSKPDTLFVLPGFHFPVNPMPLIMGGTMLWQSHLMPASPGMDPAQQKMMRYMPLIFLFFMYNVSSGLALYWTVQNLLSILQTRMIQASDAANKPPATKPPAAAAPMKKRK